MALSAGARQYLDEVRNSRARTIAGFISGTPIRRIIESSRNSIEIGGLYLVKVLEASPSIGKVRARRFVEELRLPPAVSLESIDDVLLEKVEEFVDRSAAGTLS